VAARKRWRSAARRSPRLDVVLRRLGRRVRVLRAALELSQEEVAGRAEIDAKHFQEIEAGRVNVTMASLVGLARALGTSLSKLLEGV
jgi:transcriptional regulator with XRE-family HTH domain